MQNYFANQLSADGDENITFYATLGSESNRELLISARRRHGGPTVIARKQCDAGDEEISFAEMRTPGLLKADGREQSKRDGRGIYLDRDVHRTCTQ